MSFITCCTQIHLFAHLTIAEVITTQTMFELLRSFAAVLDEFGVSHGRAKKAALCASEGLMIVRPSRLLPAIFYLTIY